MKPNEHILETLTVYGFRPMAFSDEYGLWAWGPVKLIADFKTGGTSGCMWEAHAFGAVAVMPSPCEALLAVLEGQRPLAILPLRNPQTRLASFGATCPGFDRLGRVHARNPLLWTIQ